MRDRIYAVPRRLFAAGPEGWGYDRLLLVAPLVVLVLVIFGRNVLTEALAAAYVLLFLGAFLYNGLR